MDAVTGVLCSCMTVCQREVAGLHGVRTAPMFAPGPVPVLIQCRMQPLPVTASDWHAWATCDRGPDGTRCAECVSRMAFRKADLMASVSKTGRVSWTEAQARRERIAQKVMVAFARAKTAHCSDVKYYVDAAVQWADHFIERMDEAKDDGKPEA